MNYKKTIEAIKRILEDNISDEDKCFYIEMLLNE